MSKALPPETAPSRRRFGVHAKDPETGESDCLGEWILDPSCRISDIKAEGSYREMLEEIAEELNETESMDDVGRDEPDFLSALQNYLQDAFDLEIRPITH